MEKTISYRLLFILVFFIFPLLVSLTVSAAPTCTDTSASVTVGNGDTALYVYKEGYYWTGSAWIPLLYAAH